MACSPTYCSSCGTANRGGSAFCYHCGCPLAGAGLAVNPTGRIASGHVLQQRYRIVHLVGQGGMGAVYKAEDISFGHRQVALKEMRQAGLDPQEVAEAAEKLKQEVMVLAGLKHPGVPSIYDHFTANGRWYLVMDFIEGQTLAEHLDATRSNGLPLPDILAIGIQLSKILGYLHTRPTSLVFRDLKPSNVMLTPEGDIYLIDFGIARFFKPGQTKDTAAYGSMGYASPEQYGRAQTTPQSDIYSLGALLHEMLSGNDPSRTPFQFAPLPIRGRPVPPELAALVMQMLDLESPKRPPSMAVVKQALERIADRERHPPMPPTTPIRPLYRRVSSPVATLPTPPPLPPPPLPVQPARRPGLRLVLVLAALVLILTAGASMLLRHVINVVAQNNAHATATVVSFAHATATAASFAHATAVSATVTAANPDPYQPPGRLALLDTLRQPYGWRASTNADWGGACQFASGMYQVHQRLPERVYMCENDGPDGGDVYANVAFEVRMTIIQGDCGGLTLRDNHRGSAYLFQVCQDGRYSFTQYVNGHGTDLMGGRAPAINQGAGRLNTIAVVAQGQTFEVYANGQNLGGVSDSSYSQGNVGLAASAYTAETTVMYQNARVWVIA